MLVDYRTLEKPDKSIVVVKLIEVHVLVLALTNVNECGNTAQLDLRISSRMTSRPL